MKRPLLLLLSLLLGGCAEITSRHLTAIGEGEPHADVALCRKTNLYGNTTGNVLRLDGTALTQSSAGTYSTFTVQPGSHTVGLAAMTQNGASDSKREFVAENGKAYYFYTDVDTVYQGTEEDVKQCMDYRYEFITVQEG